MQNVKMNEVISEAELVSQLPKQGKQRGDVVIVFVYSILLRPRSSSQNTSQIDLSYFKYVPK